MSSQGNSILKIKEITGFSRPTIRKVLREKTPPAIKPRKRSSKLDDHKAYVQELHEKNYSTARKYIIILKVDNNLIGFYVDRIINIDHIDINQIVELSPIFQTSLAIEYIKGIINFNERPRIMLDLGKIFTEVEKFKIQQDLSSLT